AACGSSIRSRTEGKYYAHQKGRLRTFVGAIEPMGWYDGAVILMGERLYSSLGDDEEFSLLYCDGNDMFARGWEIGNLVIRLPDNRKPIAVVDGRFATALKYHGLWIGGFDPAEKDLALCTGMPVPHPGSVGVRGSAGSNFGVLNEWKRLTSMGFGTGFAIGGEHVYCESLAAVNNIYGFTFDCYKGKRSVSDPEPERACGGSYYPIVCVNLLDEHNVHMPRFGNASHWYGEERPADENQVQAITIRGMNIQWPNTCPGHTNRLDRDYLTGRHRATEAHPGCWRGTIEYVVDRTTPRNGVNMTDEPFFEKGHGLNVTCRNLHSPVRGTSARRQQMTPNPLQRYFDTDLKKELVFDGEAWRDAAGRAADGAKVDRAEFDVTLADYPRLAGETNDTERVCRAIAATVPGDVLYFPKGIYEISRTIMATNGISLLLHKSATLKAVTKMENLLVIDRLSTWSQGGKEGIAYDQGLFLRGGHLDGNGLATCLYLNRYFHFTVRDVVFANGYPYGLHVGKAGAEIVANNLYFRTYLKGLAGNVALFSEGNDSYYTDIVVVDYTVGLRTTGGANAFTHYRVWGGFVPPVAKGRLPEMLENSICFDLGGYMNMLRDSYADTGAIGFRLGGWGQQVVGCWFLNNVVFGLKDITIVKQTPGSHDMLVADCCFRGSGPQTKLYEGPGTLKWRDMLYRGFGEGVELPAELETGPACTCA
ncbi:MAG: hypothetical protein KBT68_07830, partial [bacterium]|nr:hypothetical protein [Candidatus Colisoma equi]